MVEEEEIVSKDYYYKEKPDDEFYNYSIHGLNIEGIKKYYSIPINIKYHNMIKLNKDLKKIIENSKKFEKDKQKKYNINNRYDDERLIKKYGVKNEDNKNDNKNNKYNTLGNSYCNNNINNIISNSRKLIEINKTIEKPYEIQLDDDKINEIDNKIGKKELKQKLVNKNIFTQNINDRNTLNNNVGKYTNSINKKKIYHSLEKHKSNKTISKEINLPLIRPRKIMIEYYLSNGAGVENINKNKGHNNYMGSSFDPSNYSIKPKNRKTRNIYGSLFCH